jgi:hypothetical protein
MFIALNREALESTLIDRTISHCPMRDPPAHRVRVGQPTEECGDLVVGLRPNGKMPMIRQYAVRQYADRVTLIAFDHDPLERLEVRIPAEEPHPANGSVPYMVDQLTRCVSRDSRHVRTLPTKSLTTVNTSCVPVSPP